MRNLLALAVAILAVPSALSASVGATAGASPLLDYEIAPLLSVRGWGAFVDLGASTVGNTGSAQPYGFGGSLDLHPFRNGFRMSAGARTTGGRGGIRFNSMRHSDQTYSVMTVPSDQAGTLFSEVRARAVSPLATLGFAHTTNSRVTVGIDAGAMFQDQRYTSDAGVARAPNASNQLARQDGLIKGYDVYPLVQLSLGYTF